jgi:hypothetical protein
MSEKSGIMSVLSIHTAMDGGCYSGSGSRSELANALANAMVMSRDVANVVCDAMSKYQNASNCSEAELQPNGCFDSRGHWHNSKL